MLVYQRVSHPFTGSNVQCQEKMLMVSYTDAEHGGFLWDILSGTQPLEFSPRWCPLSWFIKSH